MSSNPTNGPRKPNNTSRAERNKDVAKGQPTAGGQPLRRNSTGGRVGSVSKKAQGVATPSEASRRATERAAAAAAQRTLVTLGILAAVAVLAIIIVSALINANNQRVASDNTTRTAVAATTRQAADYATQTAVAPTGTPIPPTNTPLPTVAYPLGVPPTAAPVAAVPTPKPGPVVLEVSEGIASKEMTIYTSKGVIVADLYPNAAPETVKNYEQRANRGEYNGRIFHRVESWVVQGNDPLGTGGGGGNITTELNKIPYKVGSLGVARSQLQYSNDSQFFITKASTGPEANLSFLNTVISGTVPTGGYTLFGQVTSGQDVADRIAISDTIYTIKVVDKVPGAKPAASATVSSTIPITSSGSLTATTPLSGTTPLTNSGSLTATTPLSGTGVVSGTGIVSGSSSVTTSIPLGANATTPLASPAPITTTGTITN